MPCAKVEKHAIINRFFFIKYLCYLVSAYCCNNFLYNSNSERFFTNSSMRSYAVGKSSMNCRIVAIAIGAAFFLGKPTSVPSAGNAMLKPLFEKVRYLFKAER